jgi:hypothetical protein
VKPPSAKVRGNANQMNLNQMINKLKQDMKEDHHKDWLGWVKQNKVFNLKTIPIDSVSPADGWEATPGKIEDMVKSDLSDAPTIVVHGDNGIIDGNHRHQALKKQGVQTIQVYTGEKK